ncbi:MAG: DUF6340 family protein [Bacteroidales bacterium]|jgi:hypothetical protein
MKVFVTLLVPISIILLLSSCAKIVYIGKTVDPEITLEKEHNDIVFVNLFDYTLPVNIKLKEKASYHAGVMGLVEGLSSFSSDSSFNFVIYDTLKKGIETGLLTTLLPVDTISAICNRYRANLLLALDSVSIFFDWETTVSSDNGGKYKTKNFNLNTNFFLSLYSATGDLIDRSVVNQSTFYRSRPTLSGFITIEPSIARASDVVGNLAFQAGEDYVEKFYPHIQQITEQLFTGKPFKESNDNIMARNWNKAIELLEQLVKSQDPVIADKARHNLEVVKEAVEANDR